MGVPTDDEIERYALGKIARKGPYGIRIQKQLFVNPVARKRYFDICKKEKITPYLEVSPQESITEEDKGNSYEEYPSIYDEDPDDKDSY